MVCVVYRPPNVGLSCLENKLMPKYVKTLSLKDIHMVLASDTNCDLLTQKGNVLCLFDSVTDSKCYTID